MGKSTQNYATIRITITTSLSHQTILSRTGRGKQVQDNDKSKSNTVKKKHPQGQEHQFQ